MIVSESQSAAATVLAPATATPSRWAPLALYAVTGFTGLVAEQGFEKYVSLLVGATASASAVVLFAYFLGFALGGLAAGRFLRNGRVRRPLLVYGVLELLVGVSCIAFSYGFHNAMAVLAPYQSLFGGSAIQFQVRFVYGCLLVLPTAVLMGASFPLIASVLDAEDSWGAKRWSQAYCANLAGAAVGALVAPVAIMPAIGLRGALWLCFAMCVGVCGMAARLAAPAQPGDRIPADRRRRVPPGIRLLLLASFASGAVFFALEVIWTHLIAVVIGCSIYAFSWMLVCVLLGLLIGASTVNRSVRKRRMAPASVLFQCCALALLIQFRLFDWAPAVFRFTPPRLLQNSFYFAEFVKLLVTAILIVPSSTLLGLIYPRLLASGKLHGADNSYLAGYLSAANSLGCLFGALLGLFVLAPLVGSAGSLKVIILALVAFGGLFLRQESPSRIRRLRAVAAGLFLVTATLWWHWNWASLTAGTGNYFGQAPTAAAAGQSTVEDLGSALAFSDENIQGGLTTVIETRLKDSGSVRAIRTMYTNGKFQGDDNPGGEQNAQFGFAAIPSLFVSRYDTALLIGLGTGHTATALRRLGYGTINVAEFAPGIVKAAGQCYKGMNEGILSDPRVHLYLEDGRNVLLTDRRTSYDLITIEISSIWFAGSTNLYSKEFYELARQRLKPDGILQQWIQLHHTSPRELAANLATARAVFPFVSLWYYGHQGMLLAANRPFASRTDVADRFMASGMSSENARKLIAELSAAEYLRAEDVSRLVTTLRPTINTDHNRWIEYATPRYQSSSFDWVTHNLAFLKQYR